MALGDGDLLEYQVQQPDPVFATGMTAALMVGAFFAPEEVTPVLPPVVEVPAIAPARTEGAVVYGQDETRWGVDDGEPPWVALFPDVLPGRAAPRPVDEGWFAYGQDASQWGVDNGEPQRIVYADAAPGPVPLPVEALTSMAYGEALDQWGIDDHETPDRIEWLDFPGRAAPHAVDELSAYAYGENQAGWGVDDGEPPLAFFPDFPGRAAPPLPVDALTSYAYVPALASWGIDDGEPPNNVEYPDRVPGPVPLPVGTLTSYGYGQNAAGWGTDSGEPPLAFYPDLQPGRRLPEPVREGAFAYGQAADRWGLDKGETPDKTDWPDFPGRARPVPTALRTEYDYVPAIRQWGLPAPPWVVYPDRAPGRRPLPVSALTSYAYGEASGTWGLDGGKIPWLPTYPDFARGKKPLPPPEWISPDVVPRITVFPIFTPSEESSGVPTIQNFGELRLLAGSSGPLEGGTDVQLAGAVVDMSPCSDDFSDGVLNPLLWTAVVVGTGAVVELGSARAVRLDSGTTAGSSAAIRSVDTVTGVDVEVTMVPDTVSLPVGGVVRAASLGLRVDASNEFRLDLEVSPTTIELRIVEHLSGFLVVNQTVTVGAGTPGPVTLRLLRSGGRVIARLNDQTVADAVFVPTAAAFEFLVSNDPVNASRARSRVTLYTRNPAVTFGGVPALAFLLKSEGTIIVEAPRMQLPGAVDVTVAGCSFSETLANGFTYVLGDKKVIGRTAASTLVVLNDPALKES